VVFGVGLILYNDQEIRSAGVADDELSSAFSATTCLLACFISRVTDSMALFCSSTLVVFVASK